MGKKIKNNLMFFENKIILLAFATADLRKSINRLTRQATVSNFYEKIKIFNSNELPYELSQKIDVLSNLHKKRGYGYWMWKPYLIKKIFNEIEYGDIINYLDIGCHIVKENYSKFIEYSNFIKKKDKWILPFQYHSNFDYKNKKIIFPTRLEKEYTKGDLLHYFEVYDNNSIIETPQFWAGCFFLKKTETSINFLNEWIEVFEKRFDLIDDTTSKTSNHKDFIENRHDQSVYSLLCKKYKLESFSAFECDWAYLDNERTWEHNKNSPILAKRDLEYSILKRFFNRQKKNIKRLIRRI